MLRLQYDRQPICGFIGSVSGPDGRCQSTHMNISEQGTLESINFLFSLCLSNFSGDLVTGMWDGT